MRVRFTLHDWLKVGVKDSHGLIELTLSDGTDVAGVVEALRETSPMLDPRACLVMIGGAQVPLDRTLKDGEEVSLYPTFSGGQDQFRGRMHNERVYRCLRTNCRHT
jgi:molybdopterin converting factor small subunit